MRAVVWIAAAAVLAIGRPAAADPIGVSSAVQQWDADDARPVTGSYAGGGGAWGLGGGSIVRASTPAAPMTASVVRPTVAPGPPSAIAAFAPPAPHASNAPAPIVAPPLTWGFVFTGVPTTGNEAPITFFGLLPTGTTLNTALLSQPITGTLTFLSLPTTMSSLGGLTAGTSGTSPTPEPASFVLLGMGLAGSLVRRRWFA